MRGKSGATNHPLKWEKPVPGVWRASFSGGSSWSDGTGSPFQFAVSATPVPEPEIYSLAGLGLWAIFLRRRK
jgi:hypothetical protein